MPEVIHGDDECLPARCDEGLGRGRAGTGRYSNASDYVRDLIRRDQERVDKLAALQQLIQLGEESGASDLSAADIIAKARQRAGVG